VRTARAAIYEAPNAPFVIREYPLRPVAEREALVRVTMSTICRSDIHSYEGRRPNPTPCILGHEIIGVLEALGAGVGPDLRGERLRAGDRVTWTEYFAEGDSYYRDVLDMPQKSRGLRKYGHDRADEDPHFTGGFAEYCYLLPGTGILKLPADLGDVVATPLNCGVATMISVTEAAEIGVGDTVVIQGLGLLGLYGVAIARCRGARLVIGLDSVPGRLEVGKTFGADLTIDVSRLGPDDLVGTIRDACRPDGADAVIEVCGAPEVIPPGLRMLRTGGRYTIGGLVNPNADVTFDANLLLRRWITLRGVHNYHPRHLVQALDFVVTNRGRFPFADLVDATFPLFELGMAFRKASTRSVLRAAIVP
jgi:putative phosphonate catabolism associated alcohol dehydrogenase